MTAGGDGVSLGQKQLIAFMRAVLREPEILILDEATANIDTVTEQLLEQILASCPPSTTKVVIAHRLNTIENADEIFFINAGEVARAGFLRSCGGDAHARKEGELERLTVAWRTPPGSESSCDIFESHFLQSRTERPHGPALSSTPPISSPL